MAKRGIAVVIGTRNETRGAAATLRDEGLDADHVRPDVTDVSTLEPLPRFFAERFGRLDILVNNAGILLDEGTPLGELDIEVLRRTFETNFFGAFAVTKVVLPLIRRSEAGDRNVNQIVEHLAKDELVLWGWNPGEGRNPVPMPHDEFVAKVRQWQVAGAPCPADTGEKAQS